MIKVVTFSFTAIMSDIYLMIKVVTFSFTAMSDSYIRFLFGIMFLVLVIHRLKFNTL